MWRNTKKSLEQGMKSHTANDAVEFVVSLVQVGEERSAVDHTGLLLTIDHCTQCENVCKLVSHCNLKDVFPQIDNLTCVIFSFSCKA